MTLRPTEMGLGETGARGHPERLKGLICWI
ncbi:Uncharacterised protein [Gordonia terrae]|nr:Uncharacterised protein [Gordonia terrae]